MLPRLGGRARYGTRATERSSRAPLGRKEPSLFCMRGPILLAISLAGCTQYPPPPPPLSFDGLPVTGSLADARKAGFTWCIEDTIEMRCRHDAVTFLGQGPFNAVVTLEGGSGQGGFYDLTLWHDRDQDALFTIGKELERQGWNTCYTGDGARGDQAIYTRAGSKVRISMDLSYWGKRRLRVLPEWNNWERRC